MLSPILHSLSLRVGTCIRLAGVTSALAFAAPLVAQNAPPAKAPHSVGEKTSEAFQKLKPLQEAQNYNGMLALLEAIPVTPNSYDQALILDMKAKIYAMTSQYSKAIEPWERAIQLSDQFGYFPEKQTLETVSLLAQLFGQEGSSSKDPKVQQAAFSKAIIYFKRFLDKTPKPAPETMMAYASILYYKGIADPNKPDLAVLAEARAIVEKGLNSAIKPKEGFYQLLLTLQQQQSDLSGSAEILELLLKQSPAKKDFWQLLMATYLQLSDKASQAKNPTLAREYLVRAIVTCERAQALGHMKTPKDNMNLVSLYLMANQFTKGTELLYNGMKTGGIESEPNNWRVLGRYYMEASMTPKAIEVLKEAAGLFPKSGEIEVQITQLHIQLENNREAMRHAKQAIAKGNFETTKPYTVHYLLAYTAYDLGEVDEANAAIASAEKFEESKKDPQFPKLKGVIADALSEREARTQKKSEKSEPAKTPASPKKKS